MKGLNKVKKTVALLATMALSISTLATYSYYGNVVMAANAEDTATVDEVGDTVNTEEPVLIGIEPKYIYERNVYYGVMYTTAKLACFRLEFSDYTYFDVDRKYLDDIDIPIDSIPVNELALLKDGKGYVVAIEGLPGSTEIEKWPDEMSNTIQSASYPCYVLNIRNIDDYRDKLGNIIENERFEFSNYIEDDISNKYEPFELTNPSGDANGDGEYTIADVVLLQSFLLGREVDMQSWTAIDLTCDGVIDAFDMILARRKLVEMGKC